MPILTDLVRMLFAEPHIACAGLALAVAPAPAYLVIALKPGERAARLADRRAAVSAALADDDVSIGRFEFLAGHACCTMSGLRPWISENDFHPFSVNSLLYTSPRGNNGVQDGSQNNR